jgi:hypothetical protein
MRGLFISGSVLVLARGDTGYRSSKSTKGVEIPQGMRRAMARPAHRVSSEDRRGSDAS